MNKVANILRLLRIHQWAKNILLFAPLFFSGHIFDFEPFLNTLIGFIIFGTAASSIYIFNDLCDVENDRIHPTKKNRPIANGAISIKHGWIICILSMFVSIFAAWFLSIKFFCVLLIYLTLNFLYSIGLKKLSLLDVFIVAIGFVLRVYSGGILTQIPVSQWLFILSFLLALFIAFTKRRDDVLIKMESGTEMRSAIKGYNLEYISSSISMLCGILVVTYLLYVTSDDVQSRFQGRPVYLTALFVLLGILRYLQITLVDGKSGSPTKILYTDSFIQLVLVLWIMSFALIIYY